MTNKAIILINPLGGMCEFREYAKTAALTIVSIYTPTKEVLTHRMGQNIERLIDSDCHSIFSSNISAITSQLELLKLHFKAVVPCHECGVEIGSAIAAHFNLNHNNVDNMLAARDKRVMRERVRDSGLRSPHFTIVNSINDIDQYLSKHDFPLVIGG